MATQEIELASFERTPPANLEAEASVLGACLLDRDALDAVMQVLKEEHFYKASHRKVFRAIHELSGRGQPVDLVTVQDWLLNRGELEGVGGPLALAGLTESVPSAANAEVYANIVRDRARLRAMISACHAIQADCYQRPEEAPAVIDRAEGLVLNVGLEEGARKELPIQELMGSVVQKVEEFRSRGAHITGLATGFRDIDERTTGLHEGELIIVAGRPGMGKTAFALNIARNVAVEQKAPAAIFSLEMLASELTMRLLCAEGRINGHHLRSGRLQPHEMHFVAKAATNLYSAPLFINDAGRLDMQVLRAAVRRLKREKGIKLVVVDYLQLLSAGVRVDSREREVSYISQSLKALAKEMRLPVLVAAQLNRGSEQRGKTGDAKPRLSDLRESGSIEQDADVVMLLYRRTYSDFDAKTDAGEPDNSAQIIIAKQRSGPTGEVDLVFHREYTRFDDLAPGSQGPQG